MSSLGGYLLQANLALLLFAAGWPLLRRLTFFGLNRAYLLLALLWAALMPALPAVPAWWARPVALAPALAARWLATPAVAPAAVGPGWPASLLALYAAGVLTLLGRLLLQGQALRRLHRGSRPAMHQGSAYRTVSANIGPCSFWQTIYLNPDGLTPAELTAVLRHEQAHVRQWHTPDVLLAQLLSILAWLNPAAWWLRRAVLTNLEYLADRDALRGAPLPDRRAYQLSLLRLAQAGTQPPLTTSFLFPPPKTRIFMLNQPASATRQTARYLLLAPLLALTLSLNTACSDAAQTGPKPVYYIDGQRATQAAADGLNPQTISRMDVFKGEDAQQLFHENRVAVITTKANENSAAVRELSAKIAHVLPIPSPPPAPATNPVAPR